MFSSADEVLAFIKDEDVKFVDIRFCDLPGVMQHFNVPAESVDKEFFTVGQMFGLEPPAVRQVAVRLGLEAE